MNANEHKVGPILHRELVYSVVGSALEVLNTIGDGLHENALAIEFGLRGISRLRLGAILNFKKPKLEWQRLVL